MSPEGLKEELQRVGRMITRWQVELAALFSGSALLALLWIFSFSDIYFQYRRPGRIALWLVLVALACAALVYIVRLFVEKHSVMGIAARLELAFPELDNRLINFLQFATDTRNDPFRKAYVRQGVPDWSTIELKRMKNRTANMRAGIALGIAVFLMILPMLFRGEAWGVSIARIVNPFAEIQPASVTRVLDVTPGDINVLQGAPLVVACRAAGAHDHRVQLEIDPADGRKSTYIIGRISAAGEKTFPYKIQKVATDIRYRFKAGDSPCTRWYNIAVRAPLAVSSLRLKIMPPPYTKAPARTLDGMSDEISIPWNSSVSLELNCNSSLKSAGIRLKGNPPVELTNNEQTDLWTGTFNVTAGDSFDITGIDEYDAPLAHTVNYLLVQDKPPAIEILAPRGRTVLPPGSLPEIEFTVTDDYGLASIAVERIDLDATPSPANRPVREWAVGNESEFTTKWRGEDQISSGVRTMGFIITARDNRSDTPNEIKSPPILFSSVSAEEAEQARQSLAGNADAALAKIIRLQKENISDTGKYVRMIEAIDAGRWRALAAKQIEIRDTAKTILTNPLRPLGNLTESIKKAYMNEMSLVIESLNRLPDTPPEKKPGLAASALNMEEKILRYLLYADAAADQAIIEQKASMLDALLKALIEGQSSLITRTRAYVESRAPISELLVDRQDNLALDLSGFVTACGTAASLIQNNEPNLAAAYRNAAAGCEEKKIREDMILAAERLDGNKASDALPHQTRALAKLEQIQAALLALRSAEEERKQEEMLDVLESAGEKIAKIKDLHKKALETMEMVKANKNMDTKDLDMLEEEYEALLKNTKEAMLEVPTDLHIFQELNCANDIVEDVITIFQECEQVEGTEDDLQDGEATEVAFTKDDSLKLLEDLEQAEERIDDFEMWLDEEPETTKFTVEAMDQEEMPDEGAALGALESQVEDIIGDLLEESEDPDDKAEADDSAVNRAVSDMPMGAAVTEGDVATFSGKGKSGNEAPDHKEQDGRSNVGRQGMSSGETSAGSGTIQEGDNNIEARRTQDPTQSGQIDAEGDADTKAFGGGKQGTGRADDIGDGKGGTQRMDSTMAGGGTEGMEALMAKVERMYDQASMKNIRSPSLRLAAHHIRQAADAVAEARSIDQIEELKKKAVAALRKAQTELGGDSTVALDTGKAAFMLEDVIEGGPDDAPPRYRNMVNEYYRILNDEI